MTSLRIRQSARALVLDEEDNVLLVNFNWAGLHLPGGFWACPGGGINAGESPLTALRRELDEELGLVDANIEGALWCLTRLFPMPGWDGQFDTWHLVRTAHFTPKPRVDLAEENIHGMKWFSRAEIRAGMVPFSPVDLRVQLDLTLTDGVPTVPRVIEAIPLP